LNSPRTSFATMYPGVGMNTPPLRSMTPELAAAIVQQGMPSLAPSQFVQGMVGGTADLAMQANQAMPWGGNDPSAIGIDTQAGTIDPSVMVPFASNVAGMATTGSLAAPPVAGGMGMGIRAYHGSPHDFDRFSMDKIGTGEGAQAYGRGLYFAENEGVARSYRDQLKRGDNNSIVHIGDRDFPSDMGNYYLRQEMEKAVPPDGTAFVSGRETYDFYNKELGDAAYRGLKRAAPTDDPVQAMAEAMDAKIKALSPYEDELPSVMAMRDAALEYAKENVRLSPNGRMYEVDIDASPDEFLDWDKPLSEQPAKVQEAVGKTVRLTSQERANLPIRTMLEMVGDGSSPGATEALRAAGIKGIRYKDAGSRATSGGELLGVDRGADGWKAKVRVTNRTGVGIQAPADMVTTSRAFPTEAEARQWAESKIGGGTSNYVVFDDSTINILKKYGLAGLTGGGAAAMALGGSTQDASAMPPMPTYRTGGGF
jgi:hypothetical protein